MNDYKLGDVVDDRLLGELYELRREYKEARDLLISMANDLDEIDEAYANFSAARNKVGAWIDSPEPSYRYDQTEWEIAKVEALEIARQYCHNGGNRAHVIDEMVRVLTGDDQYPVWVRQVCHGEDGPDTYSWVTGI